MSFAARFIINHPCFGHKIFMFSLILSTPEHQADLLAVVTSV